MPIDMAHMDMPEDEQSQARPAAAAKKTKPAGKPNDEREDRLAEALRENLRRRKAAKQMQDKKE